MVVVGGGGLQRWMGMAGREETEAYAIIPPLDSARIPS